LRRTRLPGRLKKQLIAAGVAVWLLAFAGGSHCTRDSRRTRWVTRGDWLLRGDLHRHGVLHLGLLPVRRRHPYERSYHLRSTGLGRVLPADSVSVEVIRQLLQPLPGRLTALDQPGGSEQQRLDRRIRC